MEAHRQLMLRANVHCPEIKYKCSKIAFAVTLCAFVVVRIFEKLLQLSVQSLIVSPVPLFQSGFQAVNRTICDICDQNVTLFVTKSKKTK